MKTKRLFITALAFAGLLWSGRALAEEDPPQGLLEQRGHRVMALRRRGPHPRARPGDRLTELLVTFRYNVQ